MILKERVSIGVNGSGRFDSRDREVPILQGLLVHASGRNFAPFEQKLRLPPYDILAWPHGACDVSMCGVFNIAIKSNLNWPLRTILFNWVPLSDRKKYNKGYIYSLDIIS